MISENIRLTLQKWGIKQSRLGDLTGLNRGKINSYLNGTNPGVDFMIRLEELHGYEFTIKELWSETIDYNRIPPAPVMNAKPRSETEEESKRYRLNRALRDIGDIVGDLIEED